MWITCVSFFNTHDTSAEKHTSKDALTTEPTSSDEDQIIKDFFGDREKPQSTGDCMEPSVIKLAAPKPGERNIFGYIHETMKVYILEYIVLDLESNVYTYFGPLLNSET